MSTSKYRIISLDGGGVRGLITAIMLQTIQKYFEDKRNEDFLESVNFLAGTSTGGLLALAIAKERKSPDRVKLLDRVKNIYAHDSRQVFKKSIVNGALDGCGFVAAKYTNKPLRKKLEGIFGKDMLLGELSKRVLIPTFDLDNASNHPEKRYWKPKLFHNFDVNNDPGKEQKEDNEDKKTKVNEDKKTKVVEAGLCTTAAPTFFPSVNGYIDGGVYANNPSMCAIAQTQDQRYYPRQEPDKRKVALSDIVMLSIGTGLNLKYKDELINREGIVQWVNPLIQIMFDGTTGIGDYQCGQMLTKHQYRRLNPTFISRHNKPRYVGMDAADEETINYMTQVTEDYMQSETFTNTLDWMNQHWF
ncbi:MAG: patatin-like phospholipase family protein [Cyanobacteria bacterium J06627_28]